MNATGIDGINLQATLSSKHLGRDQRAIDQFLEMWQPPATPLPVPPSNTTVEPALTVERTEASTTDEPSEPTMDPSTANESEPSEFLPSDTPTLTSQAEQPSTGTTEMEDTDSASAETVPTTTPPQLSTENNATNSGQSEDEDQQQQMDEYNLEEDVFDPASIVRDMVADDSAGRHLLAMQQYTLDKEALLGKVVQTSAGLSWTVCGDVTKAEVVADRESELPVGVKNFDFNNKSVRGPNRGQSRINLLHLLIHLWPGNWRKQLEELNKRIQASNEVKAANTRYGRVKKIHDISEREFWKFWAVLLAARIEGKQGGQLWQKDEPEGYGCKVNLSRYLKEFRFHEIKRFIPYLFAEDGLKDTDPWWQFKAGVDLYNENRKKNVSPSLLKTFDESMSAFRPRTTRYGNLPHLSNIARKPEPLGTEFKVTNSTKIGICLYLEIQRGKEGMQSHKYTDDMKKTVACSMRMAEAT